MKFKLAVMLAAIALFATAPAWAAPVPVLFDFGMCTTITSTLPGACPGNLGTTSATYGDITGVFSLTAYGYNSATATNNLFVKNGAPSETGLGLSAAADNEINFGQYIYLDMSALLSHGASSALIAFGSLQSGEFGQVCESTAVGTPGTVNCQTVGEFDSTGFGFATADFSTTDPVLAFTVPKSGDGNFLILSAVTSATTMITPEPATIVLFGTALLGLGLVSKRLRGALCLPSA